MKKQSLGLHSLLLGFESQSNNRRGMCANGHELKFLKFAALRYYCGENQVDIIVDFMGL